MHLAAGTHCVVATISSDSPPPRLRDTPTEISPNWLETISQIIGRLRASNLTLNYLPTEQRLFFQVLVPSAGIRGFLDASEFGTWLKYVRRSKDKQNMRHALLGGQIFYETVRDVQCNEELCLDERQPIQLDNSEDQDKIEEEAKSIVSHEEDEMESEENGVKCLVCDKTFPDVYM